MRVKIPPWSSTIYYLLLILLSSIPRVTSAKTTIAGCPDLESIDSIPEGQSLEDLVLCFCQMRDKSSVAVSCLYGSTLQHLQKVSTAVSNANMTITQLSIQHMQFAPSGLDDGILSSLTPSLQQLDIRECSDEVLNVHSNALRDLENTLVNVTIHGCKLKEVPAALNNLTLLETLSLSSNDIQSLSVDTFKDKNKLRYLDLSGNMITQVEEGLFDHLSNLQALIIGEHNYLNGTILDEIGKLTSLELLDISRADGVFNPLEELFPKISSLKTLKMGGCSLSSLEAGVFSPLMQLEQLDLRVNLIENISSLAFDGLSSLKRLSLAGNYIRQVESDLWAGLGSLEDLDLGWNELKTLDNEAFGAVSPTLIRLDIRHNPITHLSESLNLPELKTLIITETNMTNLNADMFKDLPKLQILEALGCNISSIDNDTFTKQTNSLEKLVLDRNKLRSFDLPLSSIPSLQELSMAGNPFLCDDKLHKFIVDVEETFKRAATQSSNFAIPNTNETTCARPWRLRGRSILGLTQHELEPYNERLDTTTASSMTTKGPQQTTQSFTIPSFTIPDLFAGKDTNESIFKDDKPKASYDLSRTDTTHQKEEGNKGTKALVTVLVLFIVTAIAIAAVALFIRKKRRVGPGMKKSEEKKKNSDGMVEIELEGQNSIQGRTNRN